MDNLALIRRILDTRLTTASFDQVYPPIKAMDEVLLSHEDLIARHKTVRIDLLELINSIILKETGESAIGEAAILVLDRVDLFLTNLGFYFK